MQRYFIQNDSVKIEVIEWKGRNPSLAPILFIPGMFGTAETFRDEIESNWQDRDCLSLSLRGRGRSDAPENCYRLADHVSDIEAVVCQLNPNGLLIAAHSIGVAYALGFAKIRPQLIKGLALLDHPPIHLPIESSWAEKWSIQQESWIPKPGVIQALQREADFVDFTDVLKILTCPILFVAGGAAGSMLTHQDLLEFSQGAKNATIHVENKSGHELETLQLKKLFGPLVTT